MKCFRLLLLFFCLNYAIAASVKDNHKLMQALDTTIEDNTVSGGCVAALELYKENLLSNSNQWALQMLDATSKIPVGLLSYNLGELGQFDQCLRTHSEDGTIQPRYCLATLPLNPTAFGLSNMTDSDIVLEEKIVQIRDTVKALAGFHDPGLRAAPTDGIGINWAICLPSNCSEEDVGGILSSLFDSTLVRCQTKEDLNPSFTSGAIAAIVVFSVFAYLVVVSTLLDLGYSLAKRNVPYVILTAFSAYSNGKKLIRINKNPNELTCMNGMRFISMLWVIIGHVYVAVVAAPVTNFRDILEWSDHLRSMTIVSGTLSVDSFFVMAGVLLSYGYFKSKYDGVKFNIFKFYIHRYLRLTPALAAAILLTAHLISYMGTGPRWGLVHSLLEKPCQKYWWTTLLYVQNYVNDNGLCLPQTWYLSVDMQLFILSPLLLIPLWRFPRVGQAITSLGVVAFIITPFCIAYFNELPGIMTNIGVNMEDYMSLYYMKTHTRAAPWFIGILLGYVLAKIKFYDGYKSLKFTKVTILVGWVICLAVTLTCVYAGHSTLLSSEFDVLANSFYIALVRPVWALCLAWIIFACVLGYGGPINWFLSLPMYQVLNRFTYSIYLLHFNVLLVLAHRAKFGVYFDEWELAYSFWGATMFSFIASIAWVLAFESPVVVLEKLIFNGFGRKSKDVEIQTRVDNNA